MSIHMTTHQQCKHSKVSQNKPKLGAVFINYTSELVGLCPNMPLGEAFLFLSYVFGSLVFFLANNMKRLNNLISFCSHSGLKH